MKTRLKPYFLFDAGSDGGQVGDTLTNSAVSVSNGLFTVMLDFGAGVFTGVARWLEIGYVPRAVTASQV